LYEHHGNPGDTGVVDCAWPILIFLMFARSSNWSGIAAEIGPPWSPDYGIDQVFGVRYLLRRVVE